MAQRLDVDLALYAADGALIARVGGALPPPLRERSGWIYGQGGPVWSVRLPDGRWIVARPPARRRHPAIGLVLLLGTIALVVAACAYPVVRGLTRRLERLQAGVETLGAGDLSARVAVEGRDEVARLADSFNRAAARIEELVNAHRLLLANASHELRTPLSRIRLGIELFQETGDAKYKAELERNIAELDELIDEILLASRLEAIRTLQTREDVDLLALVAEECARYDIAPRGCRCERPRRSAAAAPPDPQSARKRQASRQAAGSRRVARATATHVVLDVMDCGQRRPRSRARARVRAVPPAAAATPRAPGSASRWCGRSRGCTAAKRWSRRVPTRQPAFASPCRRWCDQRGPCRRVMTHGAVPCRLRREAREPRLSTPCRRRDARAG